MCNNFITLSGGGEAMSLHTMSIFTCCDKKINEKKRKMTAFVIPLTHAVGLTELATRNYNDRMRKTSCKWVLCGFTSRKNTGYKRRRVFDVVCIEIAYTTTVVMLRKFKQMSSPNFISNML